METETVTTMTTETIYMPPDTAFVNGQTLDVIVDFATDNDPNPENVTIGMKLLVNDCQDGKILVNQVGDSPWGEDQWISAAKYGNVKILLDLDRQGMNAELAEVKLDDIHKIEEQMNITEVQGGEFNEDAEDGMDFFGGGNPDLMMKLPSVDMDDFDTNQVTVTTTTTKNVLNKRKPETTTEDEGIKIGTAEVPDADTMKAQISELAAPQIEADNAAAAKEEEAADAQAKAEDDALAAKEKEEDEATAAKEREEDEATAAKEREEDAAAAAEEKAQLKAAAAEANEKTATPEESATVAEEKKKSATSKGSAAPAEAKKKAGTPEGAATAAGTDDDLNAEVTADEGKQPCKCTIL